MKHIIFGYLKYNSNEGRMGITYENGFWYKPYLVTGALLNVYVDDKRYPNCKLNRDSQFSEWYLFYDKGKKLLQEQIEGLKVEIQL